MSTIYVKRGAIVTADAFDPTRSDQGADRMFTEPGPDDPDDGTFVPEYISATIVARGRLVSLHPGDMICAADAGTLVLPPANFALVYQALDEVVSNDAIVQTGGNQ